MLSKINPNHLTAARMIATIPALFLLSCNSIISLVAFLVLMTAIEITDKLDGYIARKYNKITDWGKLFDPMADAFFHVSMYVGLAVIFSFPLFTVFVIVILFREFFVTALRAYYASRGLVLGAKNSGKAKAAFQMISIYLFVILLLLASLGVPTAVVNPLISFTVLVFFTAVALTILSLIDYLQILKTENFSS